VIRAYNEEKHLPALLESIQAQTVQEVETILVDSGSTDGTLAIAARYAVKVVPIQPGDFTFGRSLNTGIAAASAPIVVLASAHVLPFDGHWLEHLLAPFEDQQVALTYGMQRGGRESEFSEDQHWQRWFPAHSDWDQPHPYCNNANAAIRRRLWQQQPYDEELTGLEDLAWASWAKHEGYKIAYVAEAGVFHIHDEDRAQIINRHRREAVALKSILPESHFTFLNFLSMFLRRALGDWGAALRQGVFLRKAWPALRFRLLQYWGTYRGYQEAGKMTPAMKQVFYYPPSVLETRRSKDGYENHAKEAR
jgi:glycosyltransferase involved in cell wall biosynthesis